MKEFETLAKGFATSGIVGKILITFGILFFGFLCLFVWNNIQGNKGLSELIKQNKNVETLIEKQAEIAILKKCVKEAHDDMMETYNEEFLIKFGEILQENNLFPQDLNIILTKLLKKMQIIKDCLIFPEKLE